MRGVAFLRDVNQGQRGNPSTEDLRAAFADAGESTASLFRSNGTVVFEAADPARFVEDVVFKLVTSSGLERICFWLPFAAVEGIVGAYAHTSEVGRRELTLHAGGVLDRFDPQIVREATLRRCAIIGAGEGWVVCENERDRESNATPVVERITDAPATSRGLNTLARLIDRTTGRGDDAGAMSL